MQLWLDARDNAIRNYAYQYFKLMMLEDGYQYTEQDLKNNKQ